MPHAYTFAQAKLIAAQLDDNVSRYSNKIKDFPCLSNGLIPDSVRATPEWREAKHSYNVAFSQLRNFNAYYVKAFKHELAAERKARRG